MDTFNPHSDEMFYDGRFSRLGLSKALNDRGVDVYGLPQQEALRNLLRKRTANISNEGLISGFDEEMKMLSKKA